MIFSLRVKHAGLWYKVFGVLRSLVVKIYFFHRLKASGICLIGKYCDFIITRAGRMQMGKKVFISDNVQIFTKGHLKIGNNCTINEYSRIVAYENIEIGNNVVIAQFVSILDHDHKYAMENNELKFYDYVTKPIKIGNNIWIGDKCTIVKGVTIGDNVIIGAHTLVNKDVPSNCMIAGTPFAVIKTL